MKQQIQQLLFEGKIEQALQLFLWFSDNADVLLLQARFNNGKKQYNMGLIEFSEWQRTQAQIKYKLLELTNSLLEHKADYYCLVRINGKWTVQLDLGDTISEPKIITDNDLIERIKSMLVKRNVPKNTIVQEMYIKNPYQENTEKVSIEK